MVGYHQSVKKRNNVIDRYRLALRAARNKIYSTTRKNRAGLEREVAYHIRDITSYGFSFHPELYVLPMIEELEALVL